MALLAENEPLVKGNSWIKHAVYSRLAEDLTIHGTERSAAIDKMVLELIADSPDSIDAVVDAFTLARDAGVYETSALVLRHALARFPNNEKVMLLTHDQFMKAGGSLLVLANCHTYLDRLSVPNQQKVADSLLWEYYPALYQGTVPEGRVDLLRDVLVLADVREWDAIRQRVKEVVVAPQEDDEIEIEVDCMLFELATTRSDWAVAKTMLQRLFKANTVLAEDVIGELPSLRIMDHATQDPELVGLYELIWSGTQDVTEVMQVLDNLVASDEVKRGATRVLVDSLLGLGALVNDTDKPKLAQAIATGDTAKVEQILPAQKIAEVVEQGGSSNLSEFFGLGLAYYLTAYRANDVRVIEAYRQIVTDLQQMPEYSVMIDHIQDLRPYAS